MNLHERFLIVQPAGLPNTLAKAAQSRGALALIDGTIEGFERQLDGLAPERTVLRCTLDAPARDDVRMVVLTTWSLSSREVPGLRRAIAAWKDAGVTVGVEVRDRKEARRAKDAGADLLVARGAEGPGRVSPRSNLVLLSSLERFGLPLVAWGGAGPNATAALFVAAELVVLDAQLYLLPEAGLPEAWQRALTSFDGTDVRTLGTSIEEPFNVHARIADRHVHQVWEAEHAATEAGPTARRDALLAAIDRELAGFSGAPGSGLVPIGHDAAHAPFFGRLGSLEGVLAHLAASIPAQLADFPLLPDSPLAADHGTRYPVVQGAMANVSEVPAFAKAVSDAGALPFLAFAALREEWAREAVTGTKAALGEAPYGCGIIGLDLNATKRDAHIRIIKDERPPFALVAAGTAEQALDLNQEGIATYLHTPSPGILKQALDMGIERVVVEGSECGGHIGKLPSLVLWDLAFQVIGERDGVRVLLAGGVGSETSAAMAGALAAGSPGSKVGVLMGTAYLGTREIVETGAITPAYQRIVLSSKRTAITGETVGIRARSAPTPFTERVQRKEQELLKTGKPVRDRKVELEHENLGATRIAARGLKRREDGTYGEIPEDEQVHDGNYLMGQAAELLEGTTTVAELHERVTVRAAERTTAASARLGRAGPLAPDEASEVDPRAVAIVGLGCFLPDAPDVPSFWNNVLEKRVSIRELPEGRWPVASSAHLRPGEADGTYTLLGAFIDETPFDSLKYRLPPKVADQMDATQKWAVMATEQALADAGLEAAKDRSRWAVILGNALGGEQRVWTERRLALREALAAVAGDEAIDAAAQDAVRTRLEAQLAALPAITEDTMPGELANIVAARVCNVFDIGGPARTVDAACASSLAAVEEAVHLLREGAVDVAISGGVDRSMDPSAYVKFSAIGALSKEGSFPFDERASGFVMGEGAAVLVLKRLTDAVADGDNIYAVIHGAASSSDGRGKGITAPNPAGQERAVRRALADAGWDPTTLSYVEAHGTGTPVGDPAEAATLEGVLEGAPMGKVALGSVKANIGHLKAAAGAAGMLKAALAIHHGTVPPAVVETPTSRVDWSRSPLRLPTEPEPWHDPLRRAGVSAFGFGGTNSHILLGAPPAAGPREVASKVQPAAEPRLRTVSGASREAVLAVLDAPPERWAFSSDDPVRLALAPSLPLDEARKVLRGELPAELALSKGVALSEGAPGKLALVFPGQGSQYAGMVLDLAEHFPQAREVLEEADEVLTPLLGRRLSEILALQGDEGDEALKATEVCQPAVLTCDIAVLRILEELGVSPDLVAGHSLGEYAALVAADVLSLRDALVAVSARGREMAHIQVDDPGGLIAVACGEDALGALLEGLEAWPANLNGPEQTVIAGTTPALKAVLERAEAAGLPAQPIPVSAAFHSPIVAPATEPLARVLAGIAFSAPRVPVIANVTAEPYPSEPDEVRALLAKQVASPVQWVRTLERFAADGVGLVIEAGPKRVLTNLTRASLPDTPAAPTAHPRHGAKNTLDAAALLLASHGRLAPTPRRVPRASRRTAPAASPAPGATPAPEPVRTVVTGVSLGLPGGGDPFAPGADVELLRGGNRITPVPEATKARIAGLGITRLVKDGGAPRLEPITHPSQVVQLAGTLGPVDLTEYDATEDWLGHLDATAELAVAAALNALTDAHIPLVRERRRASTGAVLEGGWVLPEPLQGGTGVILASAFAGYDSLLRTVVERTAGTPTGGSDWQAVASYLADLLPEIGDRAAREKALALFHALDRPGASPTPSVNGERAPFPSDFLFKAYAMGHAQVAQLLRARGPNLHVNAACASTTSALALAQDWIRNGRCKRVLVIGADVAGNDALLPWVGAGFLTAGAATTSDRVEDAALPFDKRRNGMLIGSGAVCLVLEDAAEAEARGVTPLAELVATHVANSAFHGARLEPGHVSEEVAGFVERAAGTLGVDKASLAKDLVFVSHEPATPARGGSAEAEVRALRAALGDNARDVVISNTKGLTGHAMGAGLEDGVAVRILQHRRAPPVANLTEVDDSFADLSFSAGEATDRGTVLRFSAGFGSQLALALFRRTHPEPGKVDAARFAAWLESALGPGHELVREKRLLRAVPEGAPRVEEARAAPAPQPAVQPVATPPPAPTPVAADAPDLVSLLVELVSERTGYPVEVIDPDMDLEGDLGVDTVKQAEVIAAARERLSIPPIEGLALSDVPTIRRAAAVLAEHVEGAAPAPTPDPEPSPAPAASPASPDETGDDLVSLLVELVSERTGYPVDVIDPDMDLEGDLGVDTVKQAEVIAAARERLSIPPIEGLALSDVPTIRRAAAVLAEHVEGAAPASATSGEVPPASPDAPSREPMPVLALTTVDAAPAPVVPGPVRILTTGPVPEGLEDALARAGGTLDDGAGRVIVPVPSLEEGVQDLVPLLGRLQELPPGSETVLLARADHPAATGLGPLAATLAEEGRPTRTVLVDRAGLPAIAAELLRASHESVCLTPVARLATALAPAAPGARLALPEGATVLATGGLGAAVWPCLEALARENPGLRLVLLGRGDATDNGLDPDDEAAIAALRTELFAQAKEAGWKPAEVQARLDAAVKQARRAHALARLARVAEVAYEQLDVTDTEALLALTARLEPAPVLVVHGAGLERSRAFTDKTAGEMTAVLTAKLAPVLALTDALADAHHVAFGSIAGVTGNPGQADYALANGALTGLMARCGGTVVHWTAWEAPGGMADNDTVRTVLRERGVRYLPVDEGAELFLEAIGAPGARVVVDLPATAPLAPAPDGAVLTLQGDEPFLSDHRVGGRPLLPGVRHLEAMLGAARLHGTPVTGARAVRFDRPLWVTGPSSARVVLDGETARVEQDGRAMSHASVLEDPSELEPFTVDPSEATAWDPGRTYGALFHGPAFQVLTGATVGPEAVTATARVDTGAGAPWALALEAAMQAAGLAELESGSGSALPIALEEVALLGPLASPEATVHARLVQRDLTGATWDATVLEGKTPVLLARGIRLERTEGPGDVSKLLDLLETRSGATLRMTKVRPHDPRQPPEKKAAERGAGERAAADALRVVHGREVALDRDDDGRPFPVEAPGAVSISHGHGLAIAAADGRVAHLGVDLERVEPRAEAFLEEAFTPDERSLLRDLPAEPDQAAAIGWTLKEAASKALGTGLTVPVREIALRKLGDGTATLLVGEHEFEAWWAASERVAVSMARQVG